MQMRPIYTDLSYLGFVTLLLTTDGSYSRLTMQIALYMSVGGLYVNLQCVQVLCIYSRLWNGTSHELQIQGVYVISYSSFTYLCILENRCLNRN